MKSHLIPPDGFRLVENLEKFPSKEDIDKVLLWSFVTKSWQHENPAYYCEFCRFIKGIYVPHAILISFRPHPEIK